MESCQPIKRFEDKKKKIQSTKSLTCFDLLQNLRSSSKTSNFTVCQNNMNGFQQMCKVVCCTGGGLCDGLIPRSGRFRPSMQLSSSEIRSRGVYTKNTIFTQFLHKKYKRFYTKNTKIFTQKYKNFYTKNTIFIQFLNKK